MRNSRLVYSTDGGGRLAGPPGGRPAARPEPAPARVPDDGVVRIFRERGGRNGKTVTVIQGLPDRGAALEARAAELKRLCGAGGTARGGAVEIQGDHRDRVAEHLRRAGLTVKIAGG